MAKIDNIDKVVSSIGAAFAGVGVIVSVALVVIGVIGRYILNMAIIFIDEYTSYLLVLTTFMGLAYTLRTNGHIDVDLVVRLLPLRVKKWIRLTTSLLALALTVLLTIQTWQKTWDSFRIGSIATSPLETPLYIPQLFIPIGFGMMGLSLIAYIVRMVSTLSTGEI
jgi:TRAP-type C4-dicarboxylate transport system permease small subunit